MEWTGLVRAKSLSSMIMFMAVLWRVNDKDPLRLSVWFPGEGGVTSGQATATALTGSNCKESSNNVGLANKIVRSSQPLKLREPVPVYCNNRIPKS